MKELYIDDARAIDYADMTGIYVRAKGAKNKWESADIAQLDHESLLKWLRAGGEKNTRAENTVGILLGHGHIVGAGKERSG